MADRINDITARLVNRPTPTQPSRPRTKKPNAKYISHIEDILLHLLNHEESGTVRIVAAKVLLERMNATNKEDHDAKRREQDERAAALNEAANKLAEFAAARTAGLSVPAALDANGASGATDVTTLPHDGEGLADMAHHGVAGVGQDADGG